MTRILECLNAWDKRTVLVDLFGHDGWPGLSVLEALGNRQSIACATVCHSDTEYRFVKATLSCMIHCLRCALLRCNFGLWLSKVQG